MSDIPIDGSIWNLLNSGTTGAGSTSNSQFPGFSSQALMTPEQQAFFESQQAAFVAFQQDFQNRQQNPPQFEMPQQQSQSSNSLLQTESQPKKGRMKRTAKKGKSSEPIGDVTLRWTSDEETLLAECFVVVSEDRNVGRSQPRDTLWFRVLNEFNWKNFQKTYQGYVVKQMEYVEPSLPKIQRNLQTVHSVEKSGETSEFMTNELRLKREAAEQAFAASKDKDRTITCSEELRFLALTTKDLSPDDAYWINLQTKQIKDKLRAQMPRDSNNQNDDSDD
ncbi:hypothetical protein Tco_1287926 [Tanacetum coccineum]